MSVTTETRRHRTLYTSDDFPVGQNVRVMTPCSDFFIFAPGKCSGIVTENTGRYLGIIVRFDTPIRVKGGRGVFLKTDHNFHPHDLAPVEGDLVTC